MGRLLVYGGSRFPTDDRQRSGGYVRRNVAALAKAAAILRVPSAEVPDRVEVSTPRVEAVSAEKRRGSDFSIGELQK